MDVAISTEFGTAKQFPALDMEELWSSAPAQFPAAATAVGIPVAPPSRRASANDFAAGEIRRSVPTRYEMSVSHRTPRKGTRASDLEISRSETRLNID